MTINHRRRISPWAVAFAIVALLGVGTFAALRAQASLQSVEQHTGTVTAVSAHTYQYQCGSVGADYSKGNSGTPVFCDAVDYPSNVTVGDEVVSVTYQQNPGEGAAVPMWRVDQSSWSSVDPHSAEGALMDGVVAFVVSLVAAFAASLIGAARDW